MMTVVKRTTRLSALAAVAALALTGCTGNAMTEGAVIDGTSYSVDEVQEATAQLSSISSQPAQAGQVIHMAALAPFFDQAFDGTSLEVTEGELDGQLEAAGLAEEPNRLTREAARFQYYGTVLQDPAAAEDPAFAEALTQIQQVTEDDIKALDVEVNPRFGTWDAESGQVVPEVPQWVSSPAE